MHPMPCARLFCLLAFMGLAPLCSTTPHAQARSATGSYNAGAVNDQIRLQVMTAIANEANASFNRACVIDGVTVPHGANRRSTTQTCPVPLSPSENPPLTFQCISGIPVLIKSSCR